MSAMIRIQGFPLLNYHQNMDPHNSPEEEKEEGGLGRSLEFHYR